jgi:dihydroorotase
MEQGGEAIWGLAVNVSAVTCGDTDPREVMARALEAAERSGKPLLYGMREPTQWPLEEQLSLLRPGDVLTYCFRGGECSLVEGNGRVHPAVREARWRGVLFDVGHGMASFDFAVAEASLADGFPPDTISTDQYVRHVGLSPQHDLPRTLSKLIAAGMSEADAFAAVTARPAEILGLAGEIGTLAVGACADLAILKFNPDAAPLRDVHGVERPGGCWEPVVTVRAGELIQRE